MKKPLLKFDEQYNLHVSDDDVYLDDISIVVNNLHDLRAEGKISDQEMVALFKLFLVKFIKDDIKSEKFSNRFPKTINSLAFRYNKTVESHV